MVGDEVFQGVVTWNNEMIGKRPVVMVAHDWNGLDEYELWRAKYLAMEVPYPVPCPALLL